MGMRGPVYVPLKLSRYPSRPVPVPKLFSKYPTRPEVKNPYPSDPASESIAAESAKYSSLAVMIMVNTLTASNF